MNERPVRLRVSDNLRRSRLTVFFRLFLAIPHYFWLAVWSGLVFFSAIAQWAITVVRGRPEQPLSSFHIAYVRYATHVGAYLSLAANPFPGFLGNPGYGLDVEIDPSDRQHRLAAAFRLVLMIPALLMLAAINGGGPAGSATFLVAGGGLVFAAAFLGWFASLVRGEMPRGLRNLAAYGLRYTAEVYAYGLLITRRYPSSDPTLPAEAGAPRPHPVRLTIADDRRRSRLTTFFRFFLTVPHFVWLSLWSVFAVLAAIANWFVALVRGRPAAPLHRFLAAWVRYQTHVNAFVFLIANPFPDFTGRPGYPIDVEIDPPERQSRWVTLGRLVLAIPASIVSSGLQWLMFAAAVGGWFAALVTGRMPGGLRNIGAHALRYGAQLSAYLAVLTARYPFSGPPAAEPTFADEHAPPAPLAGATA